jgi:Ig domain of plant-specific actin-binding protein
LVRPSNLSAPTIAGAPVRGVSLTAAPGTWSGTPPPSFSYRWERCRSDGTRCSSLSGATRTTYTPTGKDIGRALRVRVTARNTAGTAVAFSKPTAVVQGAQAAATADGMPRVLELSDGSWRRLG